MHKNEIPSNFTVSAIHFDVNRSTLFLLAYEEDPDIRIVNNSNLVTLYAFRLSSIGQFTKPWQCTKVAFELESQETIVLAGTKINVDQISGLIMLSNYQFSDVDVEYHIEMVVIQMQKNQSLSVLSYYTTHPNVSSEDASRHIPIKPIQGLQGMKSENPRLITLSNLTLIMLHLPPENLPKHHKSLHYGFFKVSLMIKKDSSDLEFVCSKNPVISVYLENEFDSDDEHPANNFEWVTIESDEPNKMLSLFVLIQKSIFKFDILEGGKIELNQELKLESDKFKLDVVSIMSVDRWDQILIAFTKNKFSIPINIIPDNLKIKRYKDEIPGFEFLHLNPAYQSNEDLIVVLDKDSSSEDQTFMWLYSYGRQKIVSNFSSQLINDSQSINVQGSIIFKEAPNEIKLNYDIDVLSSLAEIKVPKNLVSSVNWYRNFKEEYTYLALNHFGLRGNNLQIRLVQSNSSDSEDQESSTLMEFMDLTCYKLKDLEFVDGSKEKVNKDMNEKLQRSTQTLYSGPFTLLTDGDNNADLLMCSINESAVTRNVTCKLLSTSKQILHFDSPAQLVDLFSYKIGPDAWLLFLMTTDGKNSAYSCFSYSSGVFDETAKKSFPGIAIPLGSFKISMEILTFVGLTRNSEGLFTSFVSFSLNISMPNSRIPILNKTQHRFLKHSAEKYYFDRVSHDNFLLGRMSDKILYLFYFKFCPKEQMKVLFSFDISLEEYRMLGIQEDKIILYHLPSKFVVIRQAVSNGRIDERKLVSTNITSLEDIKFQRGLGKFMIMATQQKVFIYDISSDNEDPLMNLFDMFEVPDGFFNEQLGAPVFWMNVYSNRAKITVWIYSKPLQMFEAYLLDSMDISYFYKISNYSTFPNNYIAEFEVYNPMLSTESKIINGYFNVHFFNSLIKAHPFNQDNNISNKDSGPNRFFLERILALGSDIIKFEVSCSLKSRCIDQIANITNKLELNSPSSVEASLLLPDIGIEKMNFVVILKDGYSYTTCNQFIRFFKAEKQVNLIPLGVKALATYTFITKSMKTLKDYVIIIIPFSQGYHFYGLKIVVFDPSSIENTKPPTKVLYGVAEFGLPKITMMSKNRESRVFTLMYNKNRNLRNEFVFSRIELLPIDGSKQLHQDFEVDFKPNLFTFKLAFHIFYFDLLSSEDTVVGCILPINSDHSYTISFKIDDPDPNLTTEIKNWLFDDGLMVSKNSKSACTTINQDLIIKCVFMFGNDFTKLVWKTLKLSLDSGNQLAASTEMTKQLPNNFELVDLKKGIHHDLITVKDKGQLRVLVFSLARKQFIGDLKHGIAITKNEDVEIMLFYEVSALMFLASFKHNQVPLPSSLYSVHSPEIRFLPAAESLRDDTGYFLELTSVDGQVEKIPFFKVFKVNKSTNILLYVLPVLMLAICIAMCYVWNHKVAPIEDTDVVSANENTDFSDFIVEEDSYGIKTRAHSKIFSSLVISRSSKK